MWAKFVVCVMASIMYGFHRNSPAGGYSECARSAIELYEAVLVEMKRVEDKEPF